MKIDAKWVVAGVGLPLMWVSATTNRPMGEGISNLGKPKLFHSVDLSDYQTRAGLLRRLAIWAGDDGGSDGYSLKVLSEDEAVVMRLDPTGSGPAGAPRERSFFRITGLHPARPVEALAHILAHIGMDHYIRRHFGWSIQPATMASLSLAADGWALLDPESKALVEGRFLVFSPTLPRIMRTRDTPEYAPALLGVTNVTEARKIIAETL